MTTSPPPALHLEFVLPLRAGEARLTVPRDVTPAEWAELRVWALATLAAAEGALKGEAGERTEKP